VATHADAFDTCENAGVPPDLVGAVHPDTARMAIAPIPPVDQTTTLFGDAAWFPSGTGSVD
jgi:hypothetical protein